MLSTKSASTNRREPIFGTNYSIHQIPSTKIVINPQLPTKNPFVSEKFKTRPSNLPDYFETDFYNPKPIILDQSGELWALPTQSLTSFAFLSIKLAHPPTLSQYAMLNLLAEIKVREHSELDYQLTLAQYKYSIEPTPSCLEFFIQGFSDKLPVLLEKIVLMMYKPQVTDESFLIHKEIVSRRFENDLMEKPIHQAFSKLKYALGKEDWSTEELVLATKAINISQLREFASRMFDKGSAQFYLQGNLDLEELLETYGTTVRNLLLYDAPQLTPSPHPFPEKFVHGTSFYHRFRITDPQEKNSGLAVYLHTFNDKAPKSESLTRMALYLLKESFFEQIRFVEKLGYDHHIDIFTGPSGGGLLITLQGPVDPGLAEIRLENIFLAMRNLIRKMSDEEFSARVKLFIAHSALYDEATRAQEYWEQIQKGIPPVARKFAMKQNYRQILREDILAFLNTFVIDIGPRRRKLSIHAIAHGIPSLEGERWMSCGHRISQLRSWRGYQAKYGDKAFDDAISALV
ncbi:metalloprotease [Entomophthora muscae]|uniref:Metalloprotease n=1 Tax=Entomophthora muscae TaxID=34485 RepID=A0ACC2T3W4_9FUNG|nr:metalloprotease [Entomophthora muscae]